MKLTGGISRSDSSMAPSSSEGRRARRRALPASQQQQHRVHDPGLDRLDPAEHDHAKLRGDLVVGQRDARVVDDLAGDRGVGVLPAARELGAEHAVQLVSGGVRALLALGVSVVDHALGKRGVELADAAGVAQRQPQHAAGHAYRERLGQGRAQLAFPGRLHRRHQLVAARPRSPRRTGRPPRACESGARTGRAGGCGRRRRRSASCARARPAPGSREPQPSARCGGRAAHGRAHARSPASRPAPAPTTPAPCLAAGRAPAPGLPARDPRTRSTRPPGIAPGGRRRSPRRSRPAAAAAARVSRWPAPWP